MIQARYSIIVVLCLSLLVFGGCTKKQDKDQRDTKNAVQKAYDETTGVIREAVEEVNDAVYN